MKKITLLFLLCLTSICGAQTTINFDADAAWSGFMNVFELPSNGGGFAFGQGWGVPELTAELNTTAGTVTLKPNFNTYADNTTDAFWVNQTTLEGNKEMEASLNVADNSLVGTSFNFVGNVESNTLDAQYANYAFIRIFDAGFALLEEITAPLVAGSDFSVTYANSQAGAVNIQYGFTLRGPNANPADEAALGSVVIKPASLSTSSFQKEELSIYPNPTLYSWNIKSLDPVSSVIVFDVMGKQVNSVVPNSKDFNIDASQLISGIYFAKVSSVSGSQQTIKLIRK